MMQKEMKKGLTGDNEIRFDGMLDDPVTRACEQATARLMAVFLFVLLFFLKVLTGI